MRWNEYLNVGNQLVGVRFLDATTETVATRYFHTDHLGSVSVITDETAGLVRRLAYDPWGKRRFNNGDDDPSGSLSPDPVTTVAFTGEEELSIGGFIHLNGRVAACLRAGVAGPDGPDARADDQRRSDRAGPAQSAGLEPLLLRRQQSAGVHRSERALVAVELLQFDR